jgi:putative ABC transport system permease protein
VRSILVVAEVALALVLVTGSAFMMRSLFAVKQVDPGFGPDHLLTIRLELPAARYRTPDELAAFCKKITDGLQTAPGVRVASFSDGLPLTRVRMMKLVVENQPIPKPGNEPAADMRGITTPAYFDTLKIPVLQGRNFTEDEIAQKLPVIIINQSLAKKLWPGQDAVGKHVRSAALKPGDQPIWLTVVGIVRDTKQAGLEEDTRPEITRSMADYTNLTLSVRTSGDPAAITAVVRQQVSAVDKDLPLFNVRTMQEIVDDSMGQRNFDSILITIFAGVALLLAAIGLYGVLMSLVAQRTNEIGIRIALGAQRGHVLRMVFSHGLRLVALGLVLGVTGSFLLARVLASMVFNVSVFDPLTYLTVVALMVFASALAIYLPARKAVRIDPLRAIRYE